MPPIREDRSETSSVTSADRQPQQQSATNWFGMQLCMAMVPEMRDRVLLDSDSSVHLFCNPQLVEGIQPAKEPLEVYTNAGIFRATQMAYVRGSDQDIPVWYSPDAVTNVLSLAQLRKQRRITYDSEKEPAFHVHFQNGVTMKFREHGEDIYSYAPPHLHHDRPTNTSYQFPQTVEDNTSMYSDRQVLRAKRARDLLHAIGCPSVADLKKVLKMNSISNCPVTEEDVQLAEKVFGPDVGSLKGKSVR